MKVLLSQIVVDPRDQLKKWPGEKEFTQSIKARGIQEELVVVRLPDPPKNKRGKNWKPKFSIVHGRHRYYSAVKEQQLEIDVRPINLDPEDRRGILEFALVSNTVKSERDPVTLGQNFQDIIDQGADVAEIAELIKKQESYVYQHLDMLKLIAPIQRAVQWGHVTFSQARELVRLDSAAQKEAFAELQNLASSRGKEIKDLSKNDITAVCRAFKSLDAAGKERVRAERGEEEEDEAPEEAKGKSKTQPDPINLYQNYLRAGELAERKQETHAERQAQDPLEALEEIAEQLLALSDQIDERKGESETRQLARRLYTVIAQIEPQLRQDKARAAMQTVKVGKRVRETAAAKRSAA